MFTTTLKNSVMAATAITMLLDQHHMLVIPSSAKLIRSKAEAIGYSIRSGK